MRRLLISFAIFLFAWLPMAIIGLPAVAVLLLTSWNGKATWFGNYLYGRQGNSHTPKPPTFFDSWYFLAIRNPVSNFGKFALSRRPESSVWLEEKTLGRIGVLYGWKHPDMRLPGSRRAFVFRPFYR